MTENSDTAQAALAEVGRQRAVLADRIRLTGWHWAAWGLVDVVFVSSAVLRLALPVPAVLAIQVAVFAALVGVWFLVRRGWGARPSRNGFWDYPSGRRPAIAGLGVMVLGLLAANRLVTAGYWQLAVGCGVLAAIVNLWFKARALAGVRADIRAGRVKP